MCNCLRFQANVCWNILFFINSFCTMHRTFFFIAFSPTMHTIYVYVKAWFCKFRPSSFFLFIQNIHRSISLKWHFSILTLLMRMSFAVTTFFLCVCVYSKISFFLSFSIKELTFFFFAINNLMECFFLSWNQASNEICNFGFADQKYHTDRCTNILSPCSGKKSHLYWITQSHFKLFLLLLLFVRLIWNTSI